MTQPLHVIFGAGPVGQAIMDELLTKNDIHIRIISRNGLVNPPIGVEVCTGDATDHAFTRQACEGATTVYFALNAPYDRWPELFPPLQKGVLAGAEAAEAKLIVMENLYAYGPTNGKPMTEDLPYRATSDKALTRAEMSRELIEAHKQGRVRVAIGRASDFFGPRVTESAMGEIVMKAAVNGGTAQVLGKPDMPHTFSYMPDIGKALVILGEREEALGEIWHLPAPETLTQSQFIGRVYMAAGNKPKIQAANRFLVRILGLFNPMMREFLKTLYQFEEPFILDHSKFDRTFGNIATPLDEAISTTVAWYQQYDG